MEMIRAADKNTLLFRNTLIALDMSVQAIAAAVDDSLCGRPVHKNVVDGVEHVDYNQYLKEFKEKLDRMDAVAAPAEIESPLVSPQDEEVHIFGGTG